MVIVLYINGLISFLHFFIKFRSSFYKLSYICYMDLNLKVLVLELTNVDGIIMALCLLAIDCKNTFPKITSFIILLYFEILYYFVCLSFLELWEWFYFDSWLKNNSAFHIFEISLKYFIFELNNRICIIQRPTFEISLQKVTFQNGVNFFLLFLLQDFLFDHAVRKKIVPLLQILGDICWYKIRIHVIVFWVPWFEIKLWLCIYLNDTS